MYRMAGCSILLHHIANDLSTAICDTWWSGDENSVDLSLSSCLRVLNPVMCGAFHAPTSTVVRVVM